MVFFISLLYAAIPIGAVIFFITSLCMYIETKNRIRKDPDSVSEKTLMNRRLMLIVSSVILGAFLAVVVGLIVLLSMAVAFM